MKIYGDKQSGNCYKVQLVCELLSKQYKWIDVDILAGDTKTELFLSKHPLGKIPLLELDDNNCISESNAIVNFIAHGSELMPTDPFLLAKCQQWQFFEQYSHEPYIAVARFIAKYLGLPEARKHEYLEKQEGGNKALWVMEQQLMHTRFLIGETLTVADISLYAYTHVAEEGGFSLEEYSSVRRWLNDIASHTNYIAMP